MLKNVGSVDRTLRIALGLAVIAAGVVFKSWWGALGVIFLATALIGWCPIYSTCRLSTRRVRGTAK